MVGGYDGGRGGGEGKYIVAVGGLEGEYSRPCYVAPLRSHFTPDEDPLQKHEKHANFIDNEVGVFFGNPALAYLVTLQSRLFN